MINDVAGVVAGVKYVLNDLHIEKYLNKFERLNIEIFIFLSVQDMSCPIYFIVSTIVLLNITH